MISAVASTKGGRGKPMASKSVSRSHKAGLQFPFCRIAHFLKACNYVERVGVEAPIYLPAVLEYLAVEGFEQEMNVIIVTCLDSSIPSLDLFFERLLESRDSISDQNLLNNCSLKLASALLVAAKRSTKKRSSLHKLGSSS